MLSLTEISAFFLALTTTALATPVVRRVAHRYGLYDKPDGQRKIHHRPIPRLGGIAIALGFFLPLLGLLTHDNRIADLFRADQGHVIGLFVGGILILGIGIYDDIRGLRARYKLLLQIGVALVMIAHGYEIEKLSIPLFGHLHLEPFASVGVTVLWFVALMNAVNLIDGLDGLAGGVAFFAVLTMYIVAGMETPTNLMTAVFAATLGGAVLGFLFYNFNPATIFMGDCGSLFLGFALATVSINTQSKSSTAIAITASVMALGLPVIDTLLSIVRRMRRGRPVFDADREHLHHRLLALGFHPKHVALMLYGLCGVLGVFAVIVKVQGRDNFRMGIVIAAMVALLAIVYRVFQFTEMVHQRRLALLLEEELVLPADARVRVRTLTKKIRVSETPDAAWSHVREVADLLGIRDSALRLYLRRPASDEVKQTYGYHRDESQFSQLPYGSLSVPLAGEALWYGDIVFTFRSTEGEDDSERRLLLQITGEALVEFIEDQLLDTMRDRFVVSRLPTPIRVAADKTEGSGG